MSEINKNSKLHDLPPPVFQNNWEAPTTSRYDTPAIFYAEGRDLAVQELEKAKIDPVTGLKNRLALEEDLDRAFKRGSLGVVYVDLNSLSRVNKLDEKHQAGDRYLKGVAQKLHSILRFGQEIYRGGDKSDEIIILAQDTNADEISGFLERIRTAGEEAISDMNLPFDTFPGISVGGALKQEGDKSPEQLMLRADNHCEDEKNRFKDAVFQEYGVDLRR
jgi:diguanylate cyclase (GGDEF)-like protein